MITHNKLLQILTGGVAAVGTTETDLTMFGTDSKTVMSGFGRSFIMNAWSFSQSAGYFTVHSPSMFDDQDGMKMRHIAQLPMSLFPQPFQEEVRNQEVLTMKATGSATALDQETHHLLMHYEAPGGAGGRYITYEELVNAQERLFALDFAITAPVTAIYGGSLAFSAAVYDKLRGDRDYAIIGYTTSVVQGAICINGPDTGNWRIGGPGHTIREFTKSYFADLSRQHGGAFIPVINSANKAATYVSVTNNENAASPLVTLWMALLK